MKISNMKIKNLVSINIPTYNSAAFLKLCIESIKRQTYKKIEIVIVDGGSSDDTLKIAKQCGIRKIFIYKDALLGARDLGVKKSEGEFVLLLDSDQILEKNCIEKAVGMMRKYDMLVLEEDVYKTDKWLEKLFKLDRRLIHAVKDLNPYTGVMLSRFYKKTLLEKVFNKIPEEIKLNVGGQDHAIIYFEAWNISKKVGIIQSAVKHIEPNSIRMMWKKFYRWGHTSVSAHYGKYDKMLNKKERFRNGLFKKGYFRESVASILLLIIKGIPYKFGYYTARLSLL